MNADTKFVYTREQLRQDLKSVCAELIDGDERGAKEGAFVLYGKVLRHIADNGMSNTDSVQLAREALKAGEIIRAWPGR